jgi:hypothetical protein
LNEKKLGAIIVLAVALVAPAMITVGYVGNALNPWHSLQREILALQDGYVKENASSLNVSFTLRSFTDEVTPINKLDVVNIKNQYCNIYVNGSSIDCNASPLYKLQAGDTAQINVIVLYVNNPYALSTLHNAGCAVVYVFTGNVIYYTECSLNGGVSD